jgi:hypothetical protein
LLSLDCALRSPLTRRLAASYCRTQKVPGQQRAESKLVCHPRDTVTIPAIDKVDRLSLIYFIVTIPHQAAFGNSPSPQKRASPGLQNNPSALAPRIQNW